MSAVAQVQRMASKIRRKIETPILRAMFSPRVKLTPHEHSLVKLGSHYGGWTFIDTPRLRRSTIVSCGLGEDASFDVEIVAKYGARLIVVDPTPRSIEHFKQIASRFGQARESEYVPGGKQPLAAYHLVDVDEGCMALCPKALWNESKRLRFYLPENVNHVSHSITNIQNGGRTDTPFIEVQAVTIDELLREQNCQEIELLKLDIEGAEIEVIEDMLRKGICPAQVLVEYDEVLFPSRLSRDRVERCHVQLIAAGYHLLHVDGGSNFLYSTL